MAMKKYIQVQPKQSSKGKVLALALVGLLVYGLVAQPVETAEIGQAVGVALAAIADAIIDFLQGL